MGIACSTDPLLMCFVGGQEEALEGHSPDEATLEYDRGLAAEKVEDAQELYDHDTSYPTEECSLSDESTSRPGAEQPHYTEHAVSAAPASSESADQLQHEIQPIAEEQEEPVEQQQQQQQQQRPARVRKDLQIVTAPAQSASEEDEPPSNLAALLAEAEVDAAIEQHMAALRAQSSASEATGAADTEQQEQVEDDNTADGPVSDEDTAVTAAAATAVETAASSTSAGAASTSSGHLPFIAGIAKLNLLQQQQQQQPQQRHVSSDVIGEIATVDTPVDDDHGSKSFFNQSGEYSHCTSTLCRTHCCSCDHYIGIYDRMSYIQSLQTAAHLYYCVLNSVPVWPVYSRSVCVVVYMYACMLFTDVDGTRGGFSSEIAVANGMKPDSSLAQIAEHVGHVSITNVDTVMQEVRVWANIITIL
eukprot:21152-Heterococcus_DN1.PRE.1